MYELYEQIGIYLDEKGIGLSSESANDKHICLICYEKPADFCHRHLVAKWLNDNNFKCKEWQEI